MYNMNRKLNIHYAVYFTNAQLQATVVSSYGHLTLIPNNKRINIFVAICKNTL